MTLKEKVELLCMHHRPRSAALAAVHLKINESGIKTVVKKKQNKAKEEEKEIHKAVTVAMPAGMKTLHFLQDTFLFHIENAIFMWVHRKGTLIHSKIIREIAKLFYKNLKPKKS